MTMLDLPEVQERSRRLFEDLLRQSAWAPRAARAEAEAVPSAPGFSVFDPEQAAAASELALGLSVLAAAATDTAEGLDAALTEASLAAQTEDPELVHHALSLFVTHSTEGRRLVMPRTVAADPGSFTPSTFAVDGTAAPAVEAAAAGSTGDERRLDFWREDALANEHHQHWHQVYPFSGLFPTDWPHWAEVADRQALLELLQKLDPVATLTDLGAPIAEAYDTGPAIKRFLRFRERRQDHTLAAEAAAKLNDWRNAIHTAIRERKFLGPAGAVAITRTNIGENVEGTVARLRPEMDSNLYGGVHNRGHNAISEWSELNDLGKRVGVMSSTRTAIRDPVFWRWHKEIDNLNYRWQETQEPYDLQDGAPPVVARHSLDGEPRAAGRERHRAGLHGAGGDAPGRHRGAAMVDRAGQVHPSRARRPAGRHLPTRRAVLDHQEARRQGPRRPARDWTWSRHRRLLLSVWVAVHPAAAAGHGDRHGLPAPGLPERRGAGPGAAARRLRFDELLRRHGPLSGHAGHGISVLATVPEADRRDVPGPGQRRGTEAHDPPGLTSVRRAGAAGGARPSRSRGPRPLVRALPPGPSPGMAGNARNTV